MYDQNKVHQAKANEESLAKWSKGGVQEITEVKELESEKKEEIIAEGKVEEDVPPELEEVDEETRKQEELEKTKAQKNKEWLDKVVAEQEKSKAHQASENKEEVVVDDRTSEKSDSEKMIELESIILDEKKYAETFKDITKKEITEAAEVLQKKEFTDLDELD